MKSRTLILVGSLAMTLWVLACTVPAWVNKAESIGEDMVPIAASIVEVADPALAPLITEIVNGFTALVGTLDIFKASPTATNLQAVQAAFQAVDSNVAQLESAAQIKNPTTQTTVTAIVKLLAQAVTEIAALVPPASAGATLGAPVKVSGQALGWNAKDFKKKYNAIIKGDPRFKPLK